MDHDAVGGLISEVQSRQARMRDGLQLGKALYDALLGGPGTQTVWREATAGEADGEPVRICLSADGTDLQHQLDLIKMPWGGLYDELDRLWLGSRRGILYSYFMPDPPANTCRPQPDLRVLIVHSNPVDADRPGEKHIPPLRALDTRALRETLGELAEDEQVRLEWREANAQLDDLRSLLSAFTPDVLHFVGHSLPGRHDDPRPVLIFTDRAEKASRVTASQLEQCFCDAGWHPRLVVLTSCRSAEFAVELLREGTPIAVGCRYDINDRQARELESAFYRALVRGASVDRALADGRRAVIDSTEANNPADWMAPFVATRLGASAPLVLYAQQGPKIEEPQPKIEEPQPKIEEPQPKIEEPQPKIEEPQPKNKTGRWKRTGSARVTAMALVALGLLLGILGVIQMVSNRQVPADMVLVPRAASFRYGCQSTEVLQAAVEQIQSQAEDRWRQTIQSARDRGQEVSEEEEEQEIAVLTNNLWVTASQYASLPSGSTAIEAFLCARHEVSNTEWAEYLAATPSAPVPMGWADRSCPAGRESDPVGGVSFEAARDYAQWRGRRLLTADEWEYAAGGGKGTLFPWGDEPDSTRANVRESWALDDIPRAQPVTWGEPYTFGLHNMCGNVSEWTIGSGGEAVLCGGDYQETLVSGLVFKRTSMSPEQRWPEVGFRCAADPPGVKKWATPGGLLLAGLVLLVIGALRFAAPGKP